MNSSQPGKGSRAATGAATARVPQPPGKRGLEESPAASRSVAHSASSKSVAAAGGASVSAASIAALPPPNFDPLLQLLEDPSSSLQFSRQAMELSTIVDAATQRGGFTVRQGLDFVPRVLAHMHRAIRGAVASPSARPLSGSSTLSSSSRRAPSSQAGDSPSTVLEEPILKFIELCALPLSSKTLDDQRNYQGALGAMMDAVSNMLAVPMASIRAISAVTLAKIFHFVREQCGDDISVRNDALFSAKRKEYWQAIRPSTVQSIVAAWRAALQVAVEEKSRVAALEATAKKGDDDEEPEECVLAPVRTPTSVANTAETVYLLKACVELSHYRSLCQSLTDCGSCVLACRTMTLCSAGDRRLTLCVELLWNLLQLHSTAAEACSNSISINALYDVFVFVLSMGYKLKERELRNDMIVLVTLIADCPDSLPLLVPFAEIMLDLSCGAERGSVNDAINPKFHHTTNHEELQMKTLCWKFLEKLCQGSETFAKAIFDWGFLDMLLRYVNIHCEDTVVVRWSTEQLLDLQRSVLNIFLLVAPLAGQWLLDANAIPVLVEYTHECPDKPLRNLAVGVLASIGRTPLHAHLAECGMIQVALELLQEEDQFDNVLRVDCLSILADVVDRDEALQKEFLAWDGIQVILPLLSFQPDYYSELKDAVIFGALDCIWSCVTGNQECTDALVRADGIHHILCVLETCPASIKRFPLTCLADLLQNPHAVQEFRSWVSEKTQRSAAQLLLSLWTGSGNSVSVDDVHAEFNESGTVSQHNDSQSSRTAIGLRSIGASTKRTNLSARPPSPRGRHPHDDQPGATMPHEADKVETRRNGLIQVPEDIVEIVEENNINFKVYCCFAQVGLDDHKELSALERAVLASVQVFVELCKDEVWTAVADSIENDGLQPVAADQVKLQRVREVAMARCGELHSTRHALEQTHLEQRNLAEETFYKTIIKKTDEAPPTTKGSALSITEAKIRKALMLKASFKAAMAKQQAHRSGNGTPNASGLGGHGSGAHSATPNPNGSGSVTPINGAEGKKSALVPSAKGGSERWGLGQRAMSDTEYALLQMLNKVRTDPKSLIPHLKQKLTYLNEEGNAFLQPGKPVENCVEGAAPYHELIEMLEASRPIVTLLDVPMGLLLAARDHTSELGQRMEATQEGADGSTPQMRMNRYGRVGPKSTQLLSLNHQDALEVVIQLAVDDGITSRIDRKAIFDPDMRVCGVAMGRHSIHEHVAVILLAHEYTDKPPNEQRDIYLKFNSPPARKLVS